MPKMLQFAPPKQQKPVFRVLEDSAAQDAEAKKTRTSDNVGLEGFGKTDIPFAFSFPLSDLLISEFTQDFNSLPPIPRALVPHSSHSIHTKVSLVSRMAGYVYRRVLGRKIVPFQPSPEKNPKYLLAYVVEKLECGHEKSVYPIDGETFTARKRTCHECSGLFVKKPAEADKQAQRSRSTGKSIWPAIGFAFGCACLVTGFLIFSAPQHYIYAAPKDTWRVIERINQFDYALQRVENGIPQVPWTFHFCHDLAPRFEIGETLIWFAYDDHGDCTSIAPKDRGYVLDRGSNHWPKLARNCRHIAAELPPVCDGKPQFD